MNREEILERARRFGLVTEPACTAYLRKVEDTPSYLRGELEKVKRLMKYVNAAFDILPEERKRRIGNPRVYWAMSFFDARTLAVLAYLHFGLCVSDESISKYLGIDPDTLYDIFDRIKKGKGHRVIKDYNDAFKRLEEAIKFRLDLKDVGRPRTEDVVYSLTGWHEILAHILELAVPPVTTRIEPEAIETTNVIRNFMAHPLKIQRAGTSRYYTRKQVQETILWIRRVARRLPENIPNNPDIWAHIIALREDPERARALYGVDFEQLEAALADTIVRACKEEEEILHKERCRKAAMKSFRRIQQFRHLFEGMIGKQALPLRRRTYENILTLEEIIKLARYEPETKEEEACKWVILLHVETGAREGYTSAIAREKVLELDSPEITTSLVGIKWSNVLLDHTKREVTGITVYESKTQREWHLDDFIIVPELKSKLYEFYEFAKERGKPTEPGGKYSSVVKTILHAHGITKVNTVDDFQDFYTKTCMRFIRKFTGKDLIPHDIRASHISALYELDIPLEVAVRPEGGFGVGWEDLATAVQFYWTLTQKKMAAIRQAALAKRKEVEEAIKA